MAKLLLLNKPFQVLSQFTDKENRTTLQQFITLKNIYVAGRLDFDSEGLLLLTDNGQLQHIISHPDKKQAKVYFVQVEGKPDAQALAQFRKGLTLKDGLTKPAGCELLVNEPEWIWDRNPPIRQRNNDITSWLKITLKEGKNRQVRRMTAAIGHPTLRLIRYQIGRWNIEGLEPGKTKLLEVNVPKTGAVSRRPVSKSGNKSVAFKRSDQRPRRSRQHQNRSRKA